MMDTVSVSITFPRVFIMAEQTKFNGMQYVQTGPIKLCLIFFFSISTRLNNRNPFITERIAMKTK
jgi:hypothetical protein